MPHKVQCHSLCVIGTGRDGPSSASGLRDLKVVLEVHEREFRDQTRRQLVSCLPRGHEQKVSHPGAGSMDYFAGLDVSVKETSCLHCG